ncbi:MAG: hypothetical protein FWB73_00655 [Treponema sp.]|nr:hypothetical protein [Treponema sp.]
MTNEEFETYKNVCYQEIGNRQKKLLELYGLQNYKDFWYSQTTETLQFKTDGKVEIEFEVIQIGSWSSISDSWMWAWANDSVTEKTKQKSAKIKELAEITGYDIFSLEAFEAKESIAHQLTAISANYLNAIGYYIAPFVELKLFFALTKVV